MLDELIESSFAPWGTGSRETLEDLLDICGAVTGNDHTGEYLHQARRWIGWCHRLENVRDILFGALASGWLLCESGIASGVGLPIDYRNESDGGAPATVREQPRAPFCVRLVDDVGDPVAGIDLQFSFRGDVLLARTDPEGTARVEGEPDESATVRIADVKALREVLAPRWASARTRSLPTDGEVVSREIANEIAQVTVSSWHHVTIVVLPHLRCLNVLGPHFAFGRSFPTSAAFDTLSHISDALRGTEGRNGMIFGHTDLSGPEIVNKELSERRAKSVYALLTHDDLAWAELFTGSKDAKGPGHWQEKWGPFEVRHMLTALGILGCSASALEISDAPFSADDRSALASFQRGDYSRRPAEQPLLPATGELDEATSTELFLAYSKLVSRQPVDSSRLVHVDGSPFMGCGEFNPLSTTAKDAESRRVTVLLFDPSSEPKALPCKLRTLAPCHVNLGLPAPGAASLFRCRVFEGLARCCPSVGGEAIDHDFLVRVPLALSEANSMPHIFLLESDDGTVRLERALATDARAMGDAACEIHFSDVPDSHAYRLSYELDGASNVLVDFTAYDALPDRTLPIDVEIDRNAMSSMFMRMAAADAVFACALIPSTDDDGTDSDEDEKK